MDLPAVTPLAAGAVDCQVVPLLVSTLPAVLGATNKGADVPLPKITLLAVKLVAPVPPLATGNAVPDKVIANVPVLVIGEPETDKNAGTVAATLVTEPEPGPVNAISIDPAPGVIVTPEPAVKDALVSVFPVLLPISN